MRSVIAVLALLVTIPLAADDLVATRAARGDARSIAELRALGQPGVDRMLRVRAAVRDVATYRASLDAICRQRDCDWSGLYWHTDLEAAKAVAAKQKRPILSLRLLGNLDEELSCANSRFFRTLLYSNPDIAEYLHDNYVLHWQSVRPVPRVSIDFGDGRTMTRTLTGNSIHYILDAGGRPLDAIPGLYSPQAFSLRLAEGPRLLQLSDEQLRDAHRRAAGEPLPTDEKMAELLAFNAMSRAMVKAISETALLRLTGFGVTSPQAVKLSESLDAQLPAIHVRSVDLILAKRASSIDPAMREEKATAAMLSNLQKGLAADTRRNEDDFHRRIHRWFGDGEVTTLDALNERVYRELFLTPSDDPWMGLLSEAVFTAIDGEGLARTN